MIEVFLQNIGLGIIAIVLGGLGVWMFGIAIKALFIKGN